MDCMETVYICGWKIDIYFLMEKKLLGYKKHHLLIATYHVRKDHCCTNYNDYKIYVTMWKHISSNWGNTVILLPVKNIVFPFEPS